MRFFATTLAFIAQISWATDSDRIFSEEDTVWLLPASACAADVIPTTQDSEPYYSDECKDAKRDCLDRCEAGEAVACYALAIDLQELGTSHAVVVSALFLRSCELGSASGCTNHAAGLEEERLSCSLRTYESTCRLDDPWGCTMLALYLTRGIGIEKDHSRARQILKKSCRYGTDDPACGYAVDILREIDAAAEAER